jgi:phage replication O-like protein O
VESRVSDKLLIPNTCQVPNVLLDEVIPRLPLGAVRVLLAIVRFTYGFGRASDKISYNQLSKATKLSRRKVIDAVRTLGSLLIVRPGAKGKASNEYALNLDIKKGKLLSGDLGVTSDAKVTGDQTEHLGSDQKVPLPNPSYSKPNTDVSKKRSRPSRQPGDPRVKEFIGWFAAEYEKRFKRPYHFAGGQAGNLVKRMLGKLDLPTLKRCAVALLESEDDFLCQTDKGIGILWNQINKLHGLIDQAAQPSAEVSKPLPDPLDYDESTAHA